MMPLNRVETLKYIMTLQSLSIKNVSKLLGHSEEIVSLWLNPDNNEAQIPKDQLCSLVDIQKVLQNKKLSNEDVAQICNVNIAYVNGWTSGMLPISTKDCLTILRHGGK